MQYAILKGKIKFKVTLKLTKKGLIPIKKLHNFFNSPLKFENRNSCADWSVQLTYFVHYLISLINYNIISDHKSTWI